MGKKLVTAQKPFTMLVANLRQGSDPSRGPAGNPQIMRKTYEQQYLPEIGGRGPNTTSQVGTGNHAGVLLTGVPAKAQGTITVAGNTFAGPTSIRLGQYTITTSEDFQIGAVAQATATATVTAHPSAATLTIGGQALAPAGGARTPGSNDYDNTLGTVALIRANIVAAINDAANGFVAIATATSGAGGILNLTAVPVGDLGNAVTLASNGGTITVSGATFLGGLTALQSTAENLLVAIQAIPEYATSTRVGAVVTVRGLTGPIGNETLFVSDGASPANFTLSPTFQTLTSAGPHVGPPEIT